MYKFWDVSKWGETEGTKESNGISFSIRYDTVNSFETRIPVENLIHSMRKSESNNNNKKLHLRRIRNSPNFMCKYITLWIPFFFAFFYMFSDADIIIRFALREATMVHRRWKKNGAHVTCDTQRKSEWKENVGKVWARRRKANTTKSSDNKKCRVNVCVLIGMRMLRYCQRYCVMLKEMIFILHNM